MRIFMLILILAVGSSPAFAQGLKLPISNYTNKTYGRDHEATNYCILTDHRNMVYAGNANGIMEYDGSEWRFIPVKQGAFVISMDISPSGSIFIGSQQDFGVLVADQSGSLTYQSLTTLLPEEDHFFTTVWATHANESFTAFQSEECLFIYKQDTVLPIYPETSFHTSFIVGDKLYVREREKGLMVLKDHQLVSVRDGYLFADLGIFGMFRGHDDNILIVTMEEGFFRMDPEGRIEPRPTDKDDFLTGAGIFGGISLYDGNIALNTLHEGVIICDEEGTLKAVINKKGGLKEDDIKGLWQDRHQNIWCALVNGISKIDYSSPVSFFEEDAGLKGSVHSVVRYGGLMHVGTTSGLFIEKKPEALNEVPGFIPSQNLRDQTWCLEVIGNTLVAGTANGLYTINGETFRKISGMNSFDMLYLDDLDLLLVGGSGGLSAFSPGKNWRKAKDFEDINVDIKTIAINKSSLYNNTEIWLGTSLQGCVKILISEDLSYEHSHYYGMQDGLPEDWVLSFTHGDSVFFGTREGIMHFIDESIIRKALPDSLKDSPEYYRGYFEGSEIYGREVVNPLSFLTSAHGRTWAIVNNEINAISHGTGDLVERPFQGIDLGKINYIYPEDANTVWFAAGEGIARYNISSIDKPAGTFHAAIRSVVISGDSLIFKGFYPLPDHSSPDEPGVLFQQPENAIPVLDHSHNDITFLFSSPFYDNEHKNLFSWMMQGSKSGWSEWSERRLTSYTNIHEGKYTFLIRMQNMYGDVSEPTAYHFVIQPPWYRTFPAYLSYIILSFLFVYSAVRLGQRQLRMKNERLESIVEERTEEIRKQNVTLATQKKEITDSIHYAERIQRAILPRTDLMSELVEGYFILFKPKDIVSGDFYWLAEINDKIVVTAVDCTGHGVPGAFMSMLGVSFLNKIILENNNLKAEQILGELRMNVVKSLKQTGKEGEAKDGMDMGLVVLDLKELTMEYAGANNPLYLIRDEDLEETKGDRMPIAHHERDWDFTTHKIRLHKGDTFYLISDGYADQFGGPAGKKFKYKPFKELLLDNRHKTMDEICIVLDETIEKWKAPGGPEGEIYEQVDDILVIGVRI